MATFSGTPFPTVALGRTAALAIKPDGTLESWGTGDMVPAPALTGLVSVASSANNWGLGVHDDGTVSFIGTTPSGLTLDTVPPTLTDVVQADGSDLHAAVVHSDGSVTCWGYNNNGECDVPVGLGPVFMVAAGNDFTVALLADGSVVQWGSPPASAPAVNNGVFISCYSNTVLLLLDDGTVMAWGGNSLGQANVPPGLSDVVSIGSCGSASLAAKSGGDMEVWPSAYFSIPAGLPSKVFAVGGWEAFGAIGPDGSLDVWGQYAGGEANVPAGFEAMLPGDPPPPVTADIDVTVPFSAEFSFTDGPIAAFDVTVPFGADFRGFQDWTVDLDPIQLQEVYRLVITGTPDGLPDLVINKISSWQATNQAGDRSSYVQAVIPAADEYIADISARENGELVIQKGYRLSTGETRFEEVLRSAFDQARPDQGRRSITLTVSGYMRGKPVAAGSRTLTGVRRISKPNGKRRVTCDIDMFLQPGITVTALNETFRADFINYYVNQSDKFCEVGER